MGRLSRFITEQLSWLLLLAAFAGYLFNQPASALSPFTPYLLAIMVAGSGFNLPFKRLLSVRGTLGLTGVALAVQLGLLPLLGAGLYWLLRLVGSDIGLASGLLALGVAPSEITSALMTTLAKGELALATRLMAFSILLSTFLTPLWLNLLPGQSVPLDLTSMAVELGLIIALPFLVSSLLRSRFPGLALYEDDFGALSALAVLALIFVVGGSLAAYRLDWNLALLALVCLGFNLSGYGLGWLLARLSKADPPVKIALVFTSGMREFGIATAVALNFLPPGAAVAPALYGLLMMVSASLLANAFKSH